MDTPVVKITDLSEELIERLVKTMAEVLLGNLDECRQMSVWRVAADDDGADSVLEGTLGGESDQVTGTVPPLICGEVFRVEKVTHRSLVVALRE